MKAIVYNGPRDVSVQNVPDALDESHPQACCLKAMTAG
jgi:hypothetical protein